MNSLAFARMSRSSIANWRSSYELLGKKLRRSMTEFYHRTEHFFGLIIRFLGTSPTQPHPTIRHHPSGSDIEMSQSHRQPRARAKVIGDSDLVTRALARD